MEQPEGYAIPGNENLVCHLKKSLYGLKQSPRCWNKSFKGFMISQGFELSAADPCVFLRKVKDQLAIVAVHVDDLILLTETEQEMFHDGYSKAVDPVVYQSMVGSLIRFYS